MMIGRNYQEGDHTIIICKEIRCREDRPWERVSGGNYLNNKICKAWRWRSGTGTGNQEGRNLPGSSGVQRLERPRGCEASASFDGAKRCRSFVWLGAWAFGGGGPTIGPPIDLVYVYLTVCVLYVLIEHITAWIGSFVFSPICLHTHQSPAQEKQSTRMSVVSFCLPKPGSRLLALVPDRSAAPPCRHVASHNSCTMPKRQQLENMKWSLLQSCRCYPLHGSVDYAGFRLLRRRPTARYIWSNNPV
jgi:hypothetical protein